MDSAFGIESYFEIVQNTHILGAVLFIVSMAMHKLLFKEGKEYSSAN